MSYHTNTRGLRNLLISVASAAMMLPAIANAAPSAVPATAPSISVQGKQAYDGAFAHFYSQMQVFADSAQSEAFKKEWEHKFDGKLSSKDAINTAITALAEAGQNQGCPADFNGKCLYDRTFRSYMHYHSSPGDGPQLADPIERAAWGAEWEHKFDKTGDLDTEAGTDSAIRKMRDSLGQRFDYVMSPAGTKAENEKMAAQFVGIGVPVGMNHMENVKLGGDLQLISAEPPKNSPAYGLVKFGDKIVKIEGVSVEGMTIDAATKSFSGKAGSKMNLTVERKDASGKVVSVDLTITRGYITDTESMDAETPTGDATAGIPASIKGRESIKIGKGTEMLASTPFEGSPSTGKIVDGDFIIAIDGKSIDGLTLDQAVQKIRGTAGTTVTITVERKGESKPLDFTITRRAIEQHAVHFTDLGNGVSKVKLDQFEAQNAPKDMGNAIARAVLPLASKALKTKSDELSLAKAARFDALKKALDAGATLDEKTMPIAIEAKDVYDEMGVGGGFVLDLRGNPGGDVEVFRKIASMTLPSGTMMVRKERKPGTDEIIMNEDILTPNFEVLAVHPEGAGVDKIDAHETPRVPLLLPAKMPFVVLTSEYSASASELLSGTLQANHRATIIGKTTIGKGVGQIVIRLPYGRSLHVTDFEFFPGGMKSDWIGIIVDQDVDLKPTAEGKSDTQVDAAVTEINKQIEAKAKRAKAVEAALKKHHDFFNVRNAERAAEDNKPVSEQDPSNLQ